jgi:hypothetical protein
MSKYSWWLVEVEVVWIWEAEVEVEASYIILRMQ